MANGREKMHWVGLDLGGTKMLTKVFDAKFSGIAQERTKTKGHKGEQAGLKRIIAQLFRVLVCTSANLFWAARPAVEPWDEFPWHHRSDGQCDRWKPHSSQALAIDVFGTHVSSS